MAIVQWIEAAFVMLAALALSVMYIKHRRGGQAYLCDDCKFNDASFCQKEDRPKAVTCTSYRQGEVVLPISESRVENTEP